MGVEDFEKFIHEKCPGAYVNVDLLKFAQGIGTRHPKRPLPEQPHSLLRPPGNLCIVIDGECCLDRLYGGFFNDWACGGQWNRMLQFLQLLMATMQGNRMSVVVFFNGAIEKKRFRAWAKEEVASAEKVLHVMRHIRRKCTPPPKVLWMPPAALRTCLRLALRHLMIPVVQSVEDHMLEVISFLREHDYDAIMVNGIEYAFFNPPAYYSAEAIKLTFRGSLETKELILDEVAKQLNLHPQRFPLLAALLGNFILSSDELTCFYEELIGTKKSTDENYHQLVNAVLAFVRNLSSVDDITAIGQFIFREVSEDKARKDRTERFVQSVEYYVNGTKERFRTTKPAVVNNAVGSKAEQFASEAQEDPKQLAPIRQLALPDLESFCKQIEAASLDDSVPSSSQNINDTDNGTDGPNEEAVVDTSVTQSEDDNEKLPNELTCSTDDGGNSSQANSETKELDLCVASAAFEAAKFAVKNETPAEHVVVQVPPEILRTACHRHQKGLMHRWIYQILSKSEIKIECHLEEGGELPYGWQLWRGVRQYVYAVLFNLNHRQFLTKQRTAAATRQQTNSTGTNITTGTQSKLGNEPGKYPADSATRIFVKEWVCNGRRHPYQQPDMVEAVLLPWKGVPTVQRLWFGQQPEDRKKRLKAFLSCLGADTNLMLDQSHVPQHLLLMCCVLRYMVSYSPQRILQRHELDSFLAQAVSPQLMDPNALQELQIKTLTTRGVQLAQLFMQGIEHALLANDSCGAPIPWVMCCPWFFFDGKLLQIKLDIADKKRTLLEICGGEIEQVSQVERMRQAVLEGLEMTYIPPIIIPHPARPLMPPFYYHGQSRIGPLPPDFAHRMALTARGRGMIGRRDILTRGGQLEIAGVVVGQWGGSGDKGGGRGVMPQQPQFGQVPRPNQRDGFMAPTSNCVGSNRYPLPSNGPYCTIPALVRPQMPTDFYAGAGMFPIGFVPLQAPAPSTANRGMTMPTMPPQMTNTMRFRDRIPDMRRGPPVINNPVIIYPGKSANDGARTGMLEAQLAAIGPRSGGGASVGRPPIS